MLAECMTPSQGVSLYIPLWYDSNQFKGYASMDAATFTFHSGTILIRERALNDREATLLYIPLWYDSNMNLGMYLVLQRLTLHSTLVRF